MRDVLQQRGRARDGALDELARPLTRACERQGERITQPNAHRAEQRCGVSKQSERSHKRGRGRESLGAVLAQQGASDRVGGAAQDGNGEGR